MRFNGKPLTIETVLNYQANNDELTSVKVERNVHLITNRRSCRREKERETPLFISLCTSLYLRDSDRATGQIHQFISTRRFQASDSQPDIYCIHCVHESHTCKNRCKNVENEHFSF